jgi:hypothetical protein
VSEGKEAEHDFGVDFEVFAGQSFNSGGLEDVGDDVVVGEHDGFLSVY